MLRFFFTNRFVATLRCQMMISIFFSNDIFLNEGMVIVFLIHFLLKCS